MKSITTFSLSGAFALLFAAECLVGTAVADTPASSRGADTISFAMREATAAPGHRPDPLVVDATTYVPEAHAALLGSIGVMCLLRRRRP
jgi:hypothetical protein